MMMSAFVRVLQRPLRNIPRRSIHFDTKRGNIYVDVWQESTVKSASFYEKQAQGKRKKYFYSVDLQGRVYLEETKPKNIATSIKNEQFLDFLFRRMKRTGAREAELLDDSSCINDYPYVSPCGVELNFVRPADSVVVFHSLLHDNADDRKTLVFGGSLVQPFHPERLAVSRETGRLYHELCAPNQKRLTPLHNNAHAPEYGLIRSSVAVSLCENIIPADDHTETNKVEEFSDMVFIGTEEAYPIRWLPNHAKTGPWAMPFQEEDGIEE